MFSAALGAGKPTPCPSPGEYHKGNAQKKTARPLLPEADTHLLGDSCSGDLQSASDDKDSSLRRKGKIKGTTKKHIYFKELLIEWRKSILIALILHGEKQHEKKSENKAQTMGFCGDRH